jgi:hypothetical protein
MDFISASIPTQTDGSNLPAGNLDWKKRVLSYHRQKTDELCVLEIGARLEWPRLELVDSVGVTHESVVFSLIGLRLLGRFFI